MSREENLSMGQLEDLFSLLRAVVLGRPHSTIARTHVEPGFIVSTTDTHDCGPETAILHDGGTCPVARYPTKEKALAGHRYYVEELKVGRREFTKLGYGTSVEPEEEVVKPCPRLLEKDKIGEV
jgi:hypothetical protein